jgi:hypothetical protein
MAKAPALIAKRGTARRRWFASDEFVALKWEKSAMVASLFM